MRGWWLLVLVSLGAGPATKPSADSDCVGWWRGDRAERRRVLDASMAGNDAVADEGLAVATEVVEGRRALRFGAEAGTSPLNAGASGDLNAAAEFTVACWVRVPEGREKAQARMLLKSAEGQGGWALGLGILEQEGPFFAAPGCGMVATGIPVTPLKWYHLCATIGENHLTLYVDGKAAAVAECARPPVACAAPLLLGTMRGGRQAMEGWLDDARIYRRALSAREVGMAMEGKEPPDPYRPLTQEHRQRVMRLVEQLGVESYAKREEAFGALKSEGRRIYPLLKELRARWAADPETAARIARLLGETGD